MDKRRVFAWVLLVGFVLLLINLIFIHYQWLISLIIYLVVAVYFFLAVNRKR